jgi:hypothetical protein
LITKVGQSSQVKNIPYKSVSEKGVEANILNHSKKDEFLMHVARMEDTGKVNILIRNDNSEQEA